MKAIYKESEVRAQVRAREIPISSFGYKKSTTDTYFVFSKIEERA